MTNWTKKNQITVSGFFSVLIALTAGVIPLRTAAMDHVKYLASFKTTKSGCMAKVNSFPVINNFSYSSGSISTGFNITAFIENGHNLIELMMGPIDPDDNRTIYPDSKCELVITRDTPESSQVITKIILDVNQQGKISSLSSSNYSGSKFESRIEETQSSFDKDQNLYRVSRKIGVAGIPNWAWVNATPVTNRALPKLYDVYSMIWNLMRKRDIETLRHITKISSSEMGLAEGLDSETIFSSYDLPENINDNELAPIKFDLTNYKLKTYANGRVFRLVDGIYENSPLRLQDKDGQIQYSYNPYFSIVDGRIIIIR